MTTDDAVTGSTQPVIALDLGGTKLSSAVVTSDGQLSERTTRPLGGATGADIVGIMTCDILRLRESVGGRCAAVGIAVPGIVSRDGGSVWAPNIAGWDWYPLHDAVKRALGLSETALVIDDDRACGIAGEVWRGAARGCSNAVFIAVGTGIGAGVMADGRIIRGQSGVAGSIGWFAFGERYRVEYGKCGCFESQASGTGIAERALRMLSDGTSPAGALDSKAGGLTAHDVFAALETGDKTAEAVVEDCIRAWGMAAANLVSLLDPEMIVFGGGVFGPAGRFLGRIRAEAAKWAQPVALESTVFAVSSLGGDAALFGAGKRAFDAIGDAP